MVSKMLRYAFRSYPGIYEMIFQSTSILSAHQREDEHHQLSCHMAKFEFPAKVGKSAKVGSCTRSCTRNPYLILLRRSVKNLYFFESKKSKSP